MEPKNTNLKVSRTHAPVGEERISAWALSPTEKDHYHVDDLRNPSKRQFPSEPVATVSIISKNPSFSARESPGEARQRRGGVFTTARVWWCTLIDAMLNHQRDWLKFLSVEPHCR